MPVLTVSKVTANPGETVEVKIALTNNPGVTAMRLTINYGNGISLQSVNWGNKGNGFDNKGDREATLVWFNSSGDVVGDYTFATLIFLVDGDAPSGFAEITAYYAEDDITNFEEESLNFSIRNGGITIQRRSEG